MLATKKLTKRPIIRLNRLNVHLAQQQLRAIVLSDVLFILEYNETPECNTNNASIPYYMRFVD